LQFDGGRCVLGVPRTSHANGGQAWRRHLTRAIASSGLLPPALAAGQAQVSPAVSADGKLQLYALPCFATTDDLAAPAAPPCRPRHEIESIGAVPAPLA
jgi:hypothetical protein